MTRRIRAKIEKETASARLALKIAPKMRINRGFLALLLPRPFDDFTLNKTT